MFSFVLILLCLVTVWSRDTFDSKTHVDPVPRAVLPDIQGKTGELDITLHGKPIHMTGYKSDMVFKWVAQKGSWEPHLLKLTHRLLTNGDEVVFDLGANLVRYDVNILSQLNVMTPGLHDTSICSSGAEWACLCI